MREAKIDVYGTGTAAIKTHPKGAAHDIVAGLESTPSFYHHPLWGYRQGYPQWIGACW